MPHHWLADCRWACPAFGGLEVEFLGMEFAKDAVYQTENYLTTQVRATERVCMRIAHVLVRMCVCEGAWCSQRAVCADARLTESYSI